MLAIAAVRRFARQLWVTQQTVKFHLSNIYRMLDVGNRAEACHYAHLNGVIPVREPESGRCSPGAASGRGVQTRAADGPLGFATVGVGG